MPSRKTDSLRTAFEAMRAYVARLYGPGATLEWVALKINISPVVMRIPAPPPGAETADDDAEDDRTESVPAVSPIRHSCDFRSVYWYGEAFPLTKGQAAVIRLLWMAMENGTPDLADETLRDAAGTASVNLRDVFRDSPAWGRLIVEGGTRGTHRLADGPAGGAEHDAE